MNIPSVESLRDADAGVHGPAWDRTYPVLWDRAIRLLQSGLLAGAEHEQNREDLAAQALEQLVEGLLGKKSAAFNQIATFDDLLSMTFHILRRRRSDFFRHRGRRPEDLTDLLPETMAPSPESEPSLNREELEALLDRLPPPKPEIFREHYFTGRTAIEIAEARQMSRDTVLSHLHRGRILLRRLLAGTELMAGSDS